MKTRKRNLFIATALLCVASVLFAEGTAKEVPAEALEKLRSAEGALPAATKPEKGMAGAELERNAHAFFEAGKLCHDIQNEYAEQSIGKKAQRYLKASLAYRDSALTRAYLGSSHLILARDASSVITKVREVDAGLKDVDAAVEGAPADITVRAIRVESTIDLPGMFKRLDTVTADLDILLDRYAADQAGFSSAFYPYRLFELKARELELRGKSQLARKYRERAAAAKNQEEKQL